MRITRPLHLVLIFAAVNLVWRLVFWPVSQGAYTDGILQVECFRFGMTYWPPLYALMARLLPGLGLDNAGRLISLLSGALVVIPLGFAAYKLFGMRAAMWTLAAWTVSPMAMRWSLQLMSDMPMTALWTASLTAVLLALECFQPGLFPETRADRSAQEADPKMGNQWLWLASLAGALAALTRYQGVLLLPLLVVAAWRLNAVNRHAPQRSYAPWWTLAPWAAVPLWVLHNGITSLVNHFQQIGERAAPAGGSALLQYIYAAEEFVMRSPWFFTYGLFAFMLYGLLRIQWSTARLRWAGWAALYLTLTILALQSVFASFQARYLLPLVPLVCLFAGHGLATWERRTKTRRGWLIALAAPTLVLAAALSVLVAVYQGNPFKDIREGAELIQTLRRDEQRVFSNETYNAEIGAVKTAFWSKSDRVLSIAHDIVLPGDLILISSYNAGGMERYGRLSENLIATLPAEEVGRVGRYSLPLWPDIMQEVGSHQHPLAVLMRYRRQYFETVVLRVLDPRQATRNEPTEASRAQATRKLTLEYLDELQHELVTQEDTSTTGTQ